MYVAEQAANVREEFGAGSRAPRELSADHPALELFPFRQAERPALVFGPFALFGGVPVTFVAAAQAFLVLGEPFRIGCHTRKHDLANG